MDFLMMMEFLVTEFKFTLSVKQTVTEIALSYKGCK